MGFRARYRRVTMRTQRLIVWWLAGLVVASCVGQRSNKHSDPRAARIRAELQLESPYVIESIESYLDGGSGRFVVRGANRRDVEICWDGGTRDPQADTLPRLLYVGKLREPADAVTVASARESTLVDLLQLCAEQNLGPHVIRLADSAYLHGDRTGYRALQQGLDSREQRVLEGYMLSLGVVAQRRRGYWRMADDTARIRNLGKLEGERREVMGKGVE